RTWSAWESPRCRRDGSWVSLPPQGDRIVVESDKLVTQFVDLSAIEACLTAVARRRPRATVVLEAPTPVGYAVQASQRHCLQVIPAPLLLRPGRMAWDRARPHRVVVGDVSDRGLAYAFLAVRSCGDPNTPYLLTHPSEAEAIH